MADTYTTYYGNFRGLDASSDPKVVARNRLAYSVNMWRDYESEQGAAVETFPGFRRVATSLGFDADGGDKGAVHGLYHFRTRRGVDLVVVHAGTRIYAFEVEKLARGEYLDELMRDAILSEGVADRDSTAFIFNNNLYILDGEHYLRVSDVGEESASIAASAVDAYVPTTYFNGEIYEQRNMLSERAMQGETRIPTENEDGAVAYETVYKTSTQGITGASLNHGFADDWFSPKVFVLDYCDGFPRNEKIVRADIDLTESNNQAYDIFTGGFHNCKNLKVVYIKNNSSGDTYVNPIIFGGYAFDGCDSLTDIYIGDSKSHVQIGENAIPNGVTVHYDFTDFPEDFGMSEFDSYHSVLELAKDVTAVTLGGEPFLEYLVHYKDAELGEETVRVVDRVYFNSEAIKDKEIAIELELYPAHMQTVERLNNFKDSNPDYKKTTMEAINGCTKAAVFDGRVFLTGNGELPNTVFYSHRNLTGANDPAYFGIYNYFNDGVGNTPNVDLLATPSFLMVIKSDTVQDGSVYYHTGMDNTDEFSADLLPRIYPSTQGAAGIGSAGKAVPSRLSCNFLDDPVFLSKRGLEGVSKETVNLERTVGHRSSNIDRLMLKEDLSRASLAEWKGYLVICCNGRMYLADSRYLTRHEDGSYQYEWYYLEGVGTYDAYAPRWGYWLDSYPLIEREGVSAETLDNFLTKDGERVGDRYFLRESGDVDDIYSIMAMPVYHPDSDAVVLDLYYVEADGKRYVVALNGDEKVGVGSFHGASKILAVGERLLFGTDNGDLCIVNTDMRGVAVGDRQVESDRIDRSFYSFAGVAYKSGCATTLDDCGRKGVAKTTECGTTVVRLKTMPGSRAKINVSVNGRDWHHLGDAYSSRFDFTDFQFSNFSFGENENNIVILPELTRGWVNKQYYIYNDRYEEPFGLYELSYAYYVYGRIRY